MPRWAGRIQPSEVSELFQLTIGKMYTRGRILRTEVTLREGKFDVEVYSVSGMTHMQIICGPTYEIVSTADMDHVSKLFNLKKEK